MPDCRAGISGPDYRNWRGAFQPPELPWRRELECASQRVDSIEIDGSFCSLQKPSSLGRWREETPDGSLFPVEGSRHITHMKKLKDVRVPLANLFASGVRRPGDQLGSVLWRLPPRIPFREKRTATSWSCCRGPPRRRRRSRGYGDPRLEEWASWPRAWTGGSSPADAVRIADCPPRDAAPRDAYVYFDNDAKVRAPFDAMRLADRLRAAR